MGFKILFSKAVLGLVCGAVLGAAGTYFFFPGNPDHGTIKREGGYALVNPLLACDVSENDRAPELSELRARIERTVRGLTDADKARRISVYVRNMDTGAWTGVDEDALYAPASLMKVPLLIGYLKEVGVNPALLDTPLTLPTFDDNARETYQASSNITSGGTYSVNNLLIAAIRNSDNNAAQALTNHIDRSVLARVYENFGASSVPEAEILKDVMSPKVYMRFFRILYNASYLSKELSQQALALLAETEFKDGMVKGVPVGVLVAHKFGERTVAHRDLITGATSIEKRELHDCGIVYYPKHPYGLCIMTEGEDFPALASAIATVSKDIYAAAEAGALSQ